MASNSYAEDYRKVFDAAPDGILLVDSQGVVRQANLQAARLFGYEPGELIGQAVELLVPATLRVAHRRHRETYVENPHTRPMGIGMELAGVRKDGAPIPVEISLSPLKSSQGDMVIATVRDLTERQRLKGFGVAALNAAEEERRRIARELHDETAQALAALLMNLTVLQRSLHDEDLSKEVATLRTRLIEATEGVRRIARGLRPPELEDVGLAAALRSFVRERFSTGTVEVEFDGSQSRLTLEQSLVAYRIAQEALSNAVRHAGAEHVRLRLRENGDGGEVVLEVEDDGAGFELESVTEPGAGLGLIGMEERAQIAGGRLEFESERGKGTCVRVRIPVKAGEGNG
jgi:PAS domain S-box-containing protein